MMKYSIVVPCYKEAYIIRNSLVRLAAYLDDTGILDDTEVVIAVQGPEDGTKAIIEEERKRFKHLKIVDGGPKGKGLNVKSGVEASSGRFVLFTDADLATPEYHITSAFEKLENGKDVVIGIRNLRKIHKGFRTMISLGSNLLTRAILLPSISDTQCGFKGFTREAAEQIFSHVTIFGWGFDMELLYIARNRKMKLAKLKIADWHDPKIDRGLTDENPIAAALRTLKELWRIRVQAWRGAYK